MRVPELHSKVGYVGPRLTIERAVVTRVYDNRTLDVLVRAGDGVKHEERRRVTLDPHGEAPNTWHFLQDRCEWRRPTEAVPIRSWDEMEQMTGPELQVYLVALVGDVLRMIGSDGAVPPALTPN